MTTTLIVGTADLRQALTAVRPHASTDAETPDLKRIRLTVGRENLTVTATDRFTAGLAIVSTWDTDIDPEGHADTGLVELLLEDVAKLLTVFKSPAKDGGEDGPQYMLRLEVGEADVTVTDCSGFDIVGRKLRLPRLETAEALDTVPVLVDRAHHGKLIHLDDAAELVVSGDNVARFRVASHAYLESLTIETRSTGRGTTPMILIRCGESFLGLMMPRRLLDEDLVRAQEWAAGWTARLPGIVGAAAGTGTP